MSSEQSDEIPRADGAAEHETRLRLRRRRRILLSIGAALILGTIFFPYDLTVDDGTFRVRLTRVRTGIYETSARGEGTRIFYMKQCAAPADDTRVVVRKGPTFGRWQWADVIFPTGEVCTAAITFGTRQEDRGVVRTSSDERRKAPHAA
jgi:hypothetical protein